MSVIANRIGQILLMAMIMSVVLVTVCSATVVQLPTGTWQSSWSGDQATITYPSGTDLTPDSEASVKCVWGTGAGNYPSLYRNIASPYQNISANDVIGFWIKVSRNTTEPLMFSVSDWFSTNTSACVQTQVAASNGQLNANQWYYVVLPYHATAVTQGTFRQRCDYTTMAQVKINATGTLSQSLTVYVGPWMTRTFAELDTYLNTGSGKLNSYNKFIPAYVLHGDYRWLPHQYFHQLSINKAASLESNCTPSSFVTNQSTYRSNLQALYMMPSDWNNSVTAVSYGTTTIDGITIEKQLLNARSGVYLPVWIYRPSGYTSSYAYPSIMMLPGHAEPGWSADPGVQVRCLSFAKRGYMVIAPEPAGQWLRAEDPTENECHDSQSAAYLLPCGESFMGNIVADNEAALTYLKSRSDVNASRICLTGCSMGGTQTDWLAAINTTIPDVISVSGFPLYASGMGYSFRGLCDVIPGAYNLVDQNMIQSLISNRPQLNIWPSASSLYTDTGYNTYYMEGWFPASYLYSGGYALTQTSGDYIDEVNPPAPVWSGNMYNCHSYVNTVYQDMSWGARYGDVYMDGNYDLASNTYLYDGQGHAQDQGAHDYTKADREYAAGWLDYWMGNSYTTFPDPDPTVIPDTNASDAQSRLNFWSSASDRTSKVSGFLTPSQYTASKAQAKVNALPPAPGSQSTWVNTTRPAMLTNVTNCFVGTSGMTLDPRSGVTYSTTDGQVKNPFSPSDPTSYVQKFEVVDETLSGVDLRFPMKLFRPTNSADNQKLVVYLDANGMEYSATKIASYLTAGYWVVCMDLRGMGSVAYPDVSGDSWQGMRYYDTGVAALGFGGTLAGYWTKDLLAGMWAASNWAYSTETKTGHITGMQIWAGNECGFPALLATALWPSYTYTNQVPITAVTAEMYLSSYSNQTSDSTYLLYGKAPVYYNNYNLGGYASIVPCIPNILNYADTNRIAALVAPTQLTISNPKCANGNQLSQTDANTAFGYTTSIYNLFGGNALSITVQ